MPHLLALLLASSASAADYGGGGVTLHSAVVPVMPDDLPGGASFDLPGPMGCFGGTGFAVESGLRLGGEGHWCTGRDSAAGLGGLQLGVQSPEPGIYGTAFATLGAGWSVGFDADSTHEAAWFFARPTVAVGLPIGRHVALETGLYAMLPLPSWERLDGVEGRGRGLPQAGLQVSLLLGRFGPEPKPVATPRRVAVPPPPPPATDDEDRPLAIPAPDQPRTPPR